MKKALFIVAAIAGYCLFEVVLLLSIAVPSYGYPTANIRQMGTGFAQLVLIPGLAAVFSRLIYGRHDWKKRVLIILALGSAGPPVLFALLFVIGLVLEPIAPISDTAADVLFAIFSMGLITALLFGIRFARRRGVQLESARWMAERQSGISPRERTWRSRAIRYSLWIPSLAVLMVFLFLPETWGVVSHCFQLRGYSLAEYRVQVPARWIILQQGRQEGMGPGYSTISGLMGRGLGFSVKRHLHWWEIPLSRWSVETGSYWTPKITDVIAQQDFLINDTHLTCVDYWPSYLSQQQRTQSSSIAYIYCYGSDRLGAGFSGERSDVPEFYKMLEHIKKTN